MKTNLLKRNATGILIIALVMFPMLKVSGQTLGNILSGSSMEADDESAWTVEVAYMDELNDTPEYEFGVDEGCTECVGNGLEIWAAGSGYTNIIFYQEITLEANKVYKAEAAYKSLDPLAQNLWAQLKIGLEGYPEHENDGVKLMGTNAWLGCGLTEDGLFSEIACDGDHISAGFIAPDSLGDTYTAHFAIVVGMWTNADNQYPYDIILDEVVLVDSLLAVELAVEPNEMAPKATLINFPNPFEGSTNIVYDLPESADVKLTVYNVMGQEVATLFEGTKRAGTHRAEFNMEEANSNILFCKLEYNDQVIVHKMTLLK